MAPHKTITINGRTYDAVTGLIVDTPAPSRPRPPHTPKASATAVHGAPQRSATLNRRFTKKPAPAPKVRIERPHTGRHMDIAKSNTVTRFAPHPVTSARVTSASTKPATVAPTTADKPARMHPTVARALARRSAQKQTVAKKPVTAKETKEAAITQALATSPKKTVKKMVDTRPWYQRARVLIGIAVIIMIIIGGLYAAYRFVPSISVGFAAMRAGISASYPEYTPDGYSLHQPVSYSDGEVVLEFISNSTNTEQYTIMQKESSWDSTAVLDNVVRPKAGDNYTTTKERGLTIYMYNNDAYWVNGGILYSIQGNAPLSGDQIRRIATSL